MKKQTITQWLFFYEQRENRSRSLWIAFAVCTLAVLCVFGGFATLQWAIEGASDTGNIAPTQAGKPFAVSKYSLTEMYVLGIQGVKYQLWIALALILRWFGLFAYRCEGSSARRKWLGILIAEVTFILAVMIFAWYCWRSYRVLVIDTVCDGCMHTSLLGSSPLWTSLLTFLMLIHTVYGIARLVVPLIDTVKAEGGRS